VAAKPPEKQQPLKSTALARDLVQQLEKKPPETSSASVDTTSRPNLNDRLDQMRQDIRKKESAATSSTSVKSGTGSGTETGSTSQTGDRMAGIIDAYCHRAGAQIKRNWAFNEQLAGGNNTLMVKIAFKVMPNGDIVDIFFVDRSDNKHLNDSAYNAIVKSSPVSPHPPQIRQPYVQMGIEFTPKDIH
ncbi:TonB C-terminal domain-containing protein, partial [Desulfosarcina sp. OttesenSCG-928-G10]|nr:TonB C-terminal domain-containing protein [Desulfosarcina sp. OttesenSCG-928-G10]